MLFYCTSKNDDSSIRLSKEFSKYFDDQIVVSTKKEFLDHSSNDIELIISDRNDFILTADMLNAAPYAINTHPSLLPMYKGSYPIFWCALFNDKHGVSIHHMDQGIDTGDIIAQQEITYDDNETFQELWQRTRFITETLLLSVLQTYIKSGKKFPRKKQAKYSCNIRNRVWKIVETLDMISFLPNGWETPISVARDILLDQISEMKELAK